MLARCAACVAGSLQELLGVTHCSSVDPICGVARENELLYAQLSYWPVNLISGTLPAFLGNSEPACANKLCDGDCERLGGIATRGAYLAS
jgi:hypothetical protein